MLVSFIGPDLLFSWKFFIRFCTRNIFLIYTSSLSYDIHLLLYSVTVFFLSPSLFHFFCHQTSLFWLNDGIWSDICLCEETSLFWLNFCKIISFLELKAVRKNILFIIKLWKQLCHLIFVFILYYWAIWISFIFITF